MPTMQEYLERVENILVLRNLTPSTVRNYVAMCSIFLTWCDQIGVASEELTVVQVQSYILSLKNIVRYAPKTINSNISVIRFFFNYILYRPLDRYTPKRGLCRTGNSFQGRIGCIYKCSTKS